MEKPEKGFYYHYKHDADGDKYNYTYEVLGVARHTEERNFTVIYRPLYLNTFLEPADYCARPLDMFMENVEVKGIITPRFTIITDEKIIAELTKIRDEMYQN